MRFSLEPKLEVKDIKHDKAINQINILFEGCKIIF
tara:strand:- start:964 stop:1068 length:105 start_codon:yes stop_codon:yes gene_type:complete